MKCEVIQSRHTLSILDIFFDYLANILLSNNKYILYCTVLYLFNVVVSVKHVQSNQVSVFYCVTQTVVSIFRVSHSSQRLSSIK